MNLKALGLGNIFGKGVKKVAPAVTEVIENGAKNIETKVATEIKTFVRPQDTLAFSQKRQGSKYFYELKNDIYEVNNKISALTEAKAPERIIKAVQKEYKLSVDSKKTPIQYSEKAKSLLEQKRIKIETEKFLQAQEKQIQQHQQQISRLKIMPESFNTIKFEDPDEVLKLIQSGEFKYSEHNLIGRLGEIGKPEHAEKLFPEMKSLVEALGDTAKGNHNDFQAAYKLADRINVINSIGNKAQKEKLFNEINIILNGTKNKQITNAVFNGIGEIGKTNPTPNEYTNVLLNHLFSDKEKMVYEHLANFNGQFHTIANGALKNPENKQILKAAYKSAKTPEQKQILQNLILKNDDLTKTAICTTPDITNDNELYKGEILKAIYDNKFETLSNHHKDLLSKALKAE